MEASLHPALSELVIIKMHVLIVGGGLGGLGLAQSLRKQGISFEVFERDENADSRFQGWAIGLHTYAATRCHPPVVLTVPQYNQRPSEGFSIRCW